MKRDVYYRGKPGAKYGIWNTGRKCWQFGICEVLSLVWQSDGFGGERVCLKIKPVAVTSASALASR